MLKKIFLLVLVVSLGVSVQAQSLQTVQPGDSLEVRRQKMNSNFSFLNTKYSSLNQLSHAHTNKTVVDLLPSSLGMANQFLALNAAGSGFEFRSIVAGDGILVSTVDGVTTVSISGGAGISTLNGLSGTSQTFTNDTNMTVVSGGTAHALTWAGTLSGSRGGTGNAFFSVSGPASTLKTYTFPNSNATVLTSAAAVTVAQGGTGAATLTGLLKGNGTSAFTAITDSSGLAGALSDETGSNGGFVRATGATLDSAIFTTFLRANAATPLRFYDSDSSNYLGWKAPATVAADKEWLMPPSAGATNNYVLTLINSATGETGWAAAPGATGGESNTASNVGTGSGWFKQKAGVDLQFKSLIAGSSKFSITSNTNDLTVDVVEANISRANLTGTTPVNGGGSGATTLTGILVGNGTSPFTTVTAPSGAIVGTTDAQTLIGKAFDVEAAGNVLTTTSKVYFDTAGCDGSAAASMWDSFSTNAPVATCIVGSNTVKGVLDFADGVTDLSAQRTFALPTDFTGNIDVVFKWVTSATSGNVVWGVTTGCAGDGVLDDPTFNGFSDVTDAAKGTANQLNDASIASITATGCTGGKLLHIKIARRLSQSNDTVANTARLIGFEMTIRRAM